MKITHSLDQRNTNVLVFNVFVELMVNQHDTTKIKYKIT